MFFLSWDTTDNTISSLRIIEKLFSRHLIFGTSTLNYTNFSQIKLIKSYETWKIEFEKLLSSSDLFVYSTELT